MDGSGSGIRDLEDEVSKFLRWKPFHHVWVHHMLIFDSTKVEEHNGELQ